MDRDGFIRAGPCCCACCVPCFIAQRGNVRSPSRVYSCVHGSRSNPPWHRVGSFLCGTHSRSCACCDSTQFTHAFSNLLAPLRRLGVPVDDISTTFSLTLRFIPACFGEYELICRAQRSRAAHFDDRGFVGGLVQRGRAFVPMLVGLFRHASALAFAMESRCYGAPSARTSLHGAWRIEPLAWALFGGFCALCASMGYFL